jgi:RNA polymerase sigma factor (sigma-70 family)
MHEEPKTAFETERAAFLARVTTLVHAHRARLLSLARRRGLTPEDALDCVQDAFFTFLRLPLAGPLAEHSLEAGHLLSTLVVHTALNQRRKQERREPPPGSEVPELPADLPSAEGLLAQAEARAELIQCVERLSQVQQAVVRLRLLEDCPGEEVSSLLGLSPENVRILLFRARGRLRGLPGVGHRGPSGSVGVYPGGAGAALTRGACLEPGGPGLASRGTSPRCGALLLPSGSATPVPR